VKNRLIKKFQAKMVILKKKIFLIFLILLGIVITNANAQASHNNYSIFSENINKSNFLLNQKVFAPIKAISKIWYENLSGQRRFINYFLSEVSLDGKIYYQNIPMIDSNGKNVEISDWDSPDCSISKFILYKKDDSIFLMTSVRKDGFPKPQNEPSEQKVIGYLLTTSDEIGKNPIFFKQVFMIESSKAICSSHEVDILFHNIILNFKQGE